VSEQLEAQQRSAYNLSSIGDPTSVMWPLYQGATCIPAVDAANSSCSLGAYPVYVVNVTKVAHIQAAVNFARNKGLRVVIKNTGHDYLGKSSGAGALGIWTHNLQSLDYVDNLEVGGFSGEAVHAGSGVTGLNVSRIAYENGALAVGGMCAVSSFSLGSLHFQTYVNHVPLM
jgi:FAD/FMN-containing dehydrogenase